MEEGTVVNYTLNLPVEWTREDILDSVIGNGSLAYPWWTQVDIRAGYDNDVDTLFFANFGCDGDEEKPVRVTIQGWINAAQFVAQDYPHWRSSIADKDIDADLGDMILQQAVANKVIYG